MTVDALKMPLRDFNDWVRRKHIDQTEAKKLRAARRRHKNRRYAKKSRLRRSVNELSLHLAVVGARALAEVLAVVG